MPRKPTEPVLHPRLLPDFIRELGRNRVKLKLTRCHEGGTPDLHGVREETGDYLPAETIAWEHKGKLPSGFEFSLSVNSSAQRHKGRMRKTP